MALEEKKIDTEVEILQKVLNGHTAAYGEIFSRHRQRAFALAYQYVNDYEDAKDIVQDAFIKAYQNLSKFDFKKSFSPWLMTIVRNLSIDFLRRRKKVSPDGLPENIPATGVQSRPERNVLRNEIWAALKSLNKEQREIIFLKDYQGYSYNEIAEILKIPLGTVMSRLHHSRKKLISVLQVTDDEM